MKKITRGYLKGYYGYKNFGDEVLLLGVIDYLFSHYPLELLYIEAGDKERLETWLQRHKELIGENLCKLKVISKRNKFAVIRHSILAFKTHKFIGGGEIFAPARGWFHGGWNMAILYLHEFWRKNVTLLGGISKATSRSFRLLYKITLPYCQSIILREKTSYEYIKSLYPNHKAIILYRDFAYDTLEKVKLHPMLTQEELASKTCLQCPYLLVNINPYVDMSILTKKLSMLTQDDIKQSIVYFPCDVEDKPFYSDLSMCLASHSLTMFDWTEYDIFVTISVMYWCQNAVGVRLHFLAFLHRMGKKYEYVVYQEKVTKFLEHN